VTANRKELGLPYVPVDPGIETSERMMLLMEALGREGDTILPWHVVRLLLWAGENRPDGNLGRIGAKQLAIICAWPEDPETWLNALFKSGWLIDVESLKVGTGTAASCSLSVRSSDARTESASSAIAIKSVTEMSRVT
jgi:hypothetical protein